MQMDRSRVALTEVLMRSVIGDKPGEAKPRFAFIVGAPRCGTTALARYLKAHPSVCFSRLKEPHYFAQHDLRELGDAELTRQIQGDYLARFFSHCEDGDALLMEGSVTYLYAPHQMEPILRLWPDAKFIIAVRDPMQMIPSLHQRLLFIGDEREPDFGRAWSLVEERRNGRSVPRGCADPRWLDYRRAGQLGSAVEEFIKVVGRDRCFISVYDDFAADASRQYRRVLKFLGLPDDGRTEFKAERTRRGYRIAWLQRLLKRPPHAVRNLFAAEGYQVRTDAAVRKPATGMKKRLLELRKRILKWNIAEAPTVDLPLELRRQMRDAFATDIRKLERILGRDLSHWLQVDPQEAQAPQQERLVA
jgi:hypothetical protein